MHWGLLFGYHTVVGYSRLTHLKLKVEETTF